MRATEMRLIEIFREHKITGAAARACSAIPTLHLPKARWPLLWTVASGTVAHVRVVAAYQPCFRARKADPQQASGQTGEQDAGVEGVDDGPDLAVPASRVEECGAKIPKTGRTEIEAAGSTSPR